MGVPSSVQIVQSADGACETPPLCADANKNYSKRAAGVVLLFELIVPTFLSLFYLLSFVIALQASPAVELPY